MKIPLTTDGLTDRILKATPLFLGSEICDFITCEGYTIKAQENLYFNEYEGDFWVVDSMQSDVYKNPYEVNCDFEMLSVVLNYTELPTFIQKSNEIIQGIFGQ